LVALASEGARRGARAGGADGAGGAADDGAAGFGFSRGLSEASGSTDSAATSASASTTCSQLLALTLRSSLLGFSPRQERVGLQRIFREKAGGIVGVVQVHAPAAVEDAALDLGPGARIHREVDARIFFAAQADWPAIVQPHMAVPRLDRPDRVPAPVDHARLAKRFERVVSGQHHVGV
jgi:hypothetical protein